MIPKLVQGSCYDFATGLTIIIWGLCDTLPKPPPQSLGMHIWGYPIPFYGTFRCGWDLTVAITKITTFWARLLHLPAVYYNITIQSVDQRVSVTAFCRPIYLTCPNSR